MLVITRKQQESLEFPSLGIRLSVLRIDGRAVKVGIEAPSDVRIIRGELLPELKRTEASQERHHLANQLNRVTLSLHLCKQLQQRQMYEELDRELNRAVDALKTLDHRFRGDGSAATSSSPNVYRALIVDDDDNERELLASILTMQGCDCETSRDGNEAIHALAQGPLPDFVLLDMQMPNCNGADTLRRIRGSERLRDLRVYSVSGNSPEQYGLAVGGSQLDGWFPKPLDLPTMWRVIQRETTSVSG